MDMQENGIQQFLHCKKCITEMTKQLKSTMTDEARAKFSPRNTQKISVGWTKEGLQVWCDRHDCNVLHVDFEGQQHPAELRG